MKIRYEKKNPAEKKLLIEAVCEITGEPSKYMGPPSMEYRIGSVIIDRDGNMVIPEGAETENLLSALKEKGYSGRAERIVPVEGPCADRFSVSLPAEKLPEADVEKLKRILSAKGFLIKKALGADNLDIVREGDKVTFPWFHRIPEADQVQAYTNFILALCRMVRRQKDVRMTENTVPNEKYAFRCFLLRLGYIGDAHKKDRKILLKNFEGSGSFRTWESAARYCEKCEQHEKTENRPIK